MDRRTFMLLSGSASAGLLRWPAHRPRSEANGAVGRLRFDLDDQRRWSLWYLSDAKPIPLIDRATLGARIGAEGRLVTLADLEDITVGERRPPAGESLVVRGRAAGLYLEVEFFVGKWAPAPQGLVRLSLYPDRFLPTVRGVRFFQTPESQLVPGPGPLLALVNGYDSRSGGAVVRVPASPDGPEVVSHGTIGLRREGRDAGSLALAFEAGEPGEGRIRLSGGGVEAGSDWLPERPVRPEGEASVLRLGYEPAADALAALHTLLAPSSPVDQERFASAAVPVGWCSWYEWLGTVTEAAVIANLEFCAAHFDRRYFRVIQLDDGYQRAMGDWETNPKFPQGHRWLTDRIHARGFNAGLWLAPFAVSDRSGVPQAHADWLLHGPDREPPPLVVATREEWGGRVYALDSAHPGVQEWLYALARRVVREWGYDYLKADFLCWATAGAAHYGGMTHAEAYRKGLAAIRDGLGTEAFLLASGAPLQHAMGYVNGMRVGGDVEASWGGIQAPARAAALRSYYHRTAWVNDPDCLVVRPPLTLQEAQVWAAIVALSGGITMLSDDLPKLAPERVTLLHRTMPVAPVAGRPVDALEEERVLAPAIVTAEAVHRIAGPWRFRTGDDPRYATRDFDDEVWETIPVPQRWERAGRPDYDGFAWYRTRFPLPPLPGGKPEARTVVLELGKVDDADETFVNGVRIGRTGEFPPSYRAAGDWQSYRRYPVPPDALNWGGDNVLAVRVYDGGGGGGLWSVQRERPPSAWVVEAATRWWTVVLVNWDDEPRERLVPLDALGITGAAFNAYDVWQDAPLGDVRGRLTAKLAPHSTLTVALRAAGARPQVIGTSRHVVQGPVDLAAERWDQGTLTLSGRSTAQDGRAYRITVTVPRGLRAATCKSDPPCTLRRLQSGHAVLEWAAGADGRDVHWEVKFRTVSRR